MMLIASHATRLDSLIAEHGLDAFAAMIQQGSCSRVDLSSAGVETYDSTGNSRLGGDPDLPRDCPWLDKLNELVFVFQVCLSDLPWSASLGLPAEGMLYVFSDQGGDEGTTFYFPGTSDELVRHRMPAADPDYLFGSMQCFRLKAAAGIDVPGQGSDEFDRIEEAGLEDEYRALEDALTSDDDDPFCQLAGRYPDLDADVRLQATRDTGGNVEDWRSLWKILSSLDSGLQISDFHVMHGVITDADLRSRTFANIYSNTGVV